MKAPVVVFVYNRPDHARQTLKALNDNRLASETDLFIYADNAKNEKGRAKVDATRKVVDDFAADNHFKSTTVIKADVNKGLADSIINGVTDVIRRYQRVIVVEDDLTTSMDFLEYMNDALDYHALNKNIWSISAYTPQLSHLRKYNHDTYMCYRASSWGWATWLDRWETVDWSIADYDSFMKDKKAQAHFNLGGGDMTRMLADWHEGRNHSWAIRWCYCQSRQNKLTVYPRDSRVTNTGCDDSGTHSGKTSRYRTPFAADHPKCRFENLAVSNYIMKEFRLIFDFSRLGQIRRRLMRLM